jgi:hypothetical protein
VAILVLGIGANSAIFSVINALLLKPLPIDRPGQPAGIYVERTTPPGGFRAFSYPNYQDLRNQVDGFSRVAAHNVSLVGVGDGEVMRRVFADSVTANYFETFGAPLAVGRAFTPEEEQPGANLPVAIVSYAFWEREGRRPDILGETLRVNGKPPTIIGMARSRFSRAARMAPSCQPGRTAFDWPGPRRSVLLIERAVRRPSSSVDRSVAATVRSRTGVPRPKNWGDSPATTTAPRWVRSIRYGWNAAGCCCVSAGLAHSR